MKSKHQQYLEGLAIIMKLAAEPKKHRKQLARFITERHDYQVSPFSCVALTMEVGGRNFYSEGYSRQNPVDIWNPVEGLGRAYEKALLEVCEQVEQAVFEHWFDLPLDGS